MALIDPLFPCPRHKMTQAQPLHTITLMLHWFHSGLLCISVWLQKTLWLEEGAGLELLTHDCKTMWEQERCRHTAAMTAWCHKSNTVYVNQGSKQETYLCSCHFCWNVPNASFGLRSGPVLQKLSAETILSEMMSMCLWQKWCGRISGRKCNCRHPGWEAQLWPLNSNLTGKCAQLSACGFCFCVSQRSSVLWQVKITNNGRGRLHQLYLSYTKSCVGFIHESWTSLEFGTWIFCVWMKWLKK